MGTVNYYVYILECADKTLYIGSTNDLVRRVYAHNFLKSGARYTKMRRPVVLAYAQRHTTKKKALAGERALKKLSRKEKLELIGWYQTPQKKLSTVVK